MPIDDRVTLYDARVKSRYTLVLTAMPTVMLTANNGLPLY